MIGISRERGALVAPAAHCWPDQRLHAMDALRSGAILVVCAHAAISYMKVPIPGLIWPVHDASTNPIFDWIFWWIQVFCMPLFFLIAGLSAVRLYHFQGPRGFLLHRTKRILGPLSISSLSILPVTFYVWSYGWLISGRCTLKEIRRVKFNETIQPQLYGFAHLWFLQYLFLLLRFSGQARRRAVQQCDQSALRGRIRGR